ncbi:MAG: putative AGC family protein kinase, partial [Streblomastix strix]
EGEGINVKGNYSDTLSNLNDLEGVIMESSKFSTLVLKEIQAQQYHLQYYWTTQIASLTSVEVSLNISNTNLPLQFTINGHGMIQEKLNVKIVQAGLKLLINSKSVIMQYNADIIYPPENSTDQIHIEGNPQNEQTATFGMKDYKWFEYKKYKYDFLISNDGRIFTGFEGKESTAPPLNVIELEVDGGIKDDDEKSEEEKQEEIDGVDSPKGFSFPMWMIILIAVVGALLIIVIVIIIICCICKHKKQKNKKEDEVQMENINPGNYSSRMNNQSFNASQSRSQTGLEVDIVAQILSNSFRNENLSQIGSARNAQQQIPQFHLQSIPSTYALPVIQPPLIISPNASFNTSWVKTDFVKVKKLGKGAFGTVWQMKEKSTQRVVAIKVVDYDTEQEQKMIIQEKTIMLNIFETIKKSNPPGSFIHVVQPLGFFLNQDEDSIKAYLVLEFCERGDLRKYIKNMMESGTEISNRKAFELIAQVTSAVHQLHVNSIIHGDLKPENVLVMQDYRIKLSDFGLARKIEEGRDYLTAMGGTTFYLGPELLQSKDKSNSGAKKLMQTTASDIWAFGVMMFELLALRHPFFDSKEGNLPLQELIRRIIEDAPAELPDHYSNSLRMLIRNMLTKDPSRRITSADILEIQEVADCLTNK